MIKNSLIDVEMPKVIDHTGNGLSVLICTAYKHHFNWMTFASWYSIYKNLPNAKMTIACSRATRIGSYYYHWTYKCNDLRYNLHKNIGERMGLPYLNKIYGVYLAVKEGLVKFPLVVIDADMMALRDLSKDTILKLMESEFATTACPYDLPFTGTPVGPLWFFNHISLEKIEEVINTIRTLKGKDHLDLLSLSKVFGDKVVVVNDLGNEVNRDEITTFTHYAGGCGNFTKKDWEKGKTVPPFDVAYALQSVSMSANERKVLSLWGQMGYLWEAMNQVKI
jgi:hypothetical protein